MMVFPQEIRSQIASYIADDLQAGDPRCYRAARSMQAAWRGWVTRFQRWRCNRCGERKFLGIKFWHEHSGRVYARAAFAVLPDRIVRLYMRRIPLDCSTCQAVRSLYATAGT